MAISVNGNDGNQAKTTASTIATTVGCAVNAGDLVWVVAACHAAPSAPTVTDGTNTYTVTSAANGTTVGVVLAWAIASAGGFVSVTVNFGASSGAQAIVVRSYTGWTGTPTVDIAYQTTTGSATSATCIATTTSTFADGVWLGGGAFAGPGADVFSSAGTGVVTAPANGSFGTAGGSAASNVTANQVWQLNAAQGSGSISATDTTARTNASGGITFHDVAAATDGFAVASATSGYYPYGNN